VILSHRPPRGANCFGKIVSKLTIMGQSRVVVDVYTNERGPVVFRVLCGRLSR
jgi:hypothetical protein